MAEKQYINGRWVDSHAHETYKHRNPARLGEVTGVWPQGDGDDATKAIDAAAAAFPGWRALPAIRRADLMKQVLRLIDERREELARVITLENGKTLADSRAEVQSTYREMEFQIAEGLRVGGETKPTAQPGVFAYETREPLGVVSVVAPWNFPLNVPGRKSTPALMAGNTLVFKPASLTPGVGKAFVDLFHEAGFPPGVINMVVGPGSTVGAAFTGSPRIRAISFTGSTEVGRRIHRVASEAMIRTQLEMGGKNAIVVLADADLDAAAASAARAAYACTGQWCTCTSRAVVEKPVLDEFTERLRHYVEQMKTGDGADESTDMGPLCGTEQLETVGDYLRVGTREGARLLTGGERLTGDRYDDGCFIPPTIFADVKPEMRIAQEEIFGPVLSVMEASGFDEAVRIANEVPFGLSSSVYTNDLNRAMSFIEQIEAGLVHVNMLTAYKEPGFAFGGVKDSGFGTPEAGSSGIEFFTEHKVAYIKYR